MNLLVLTGIFPPEVGGPATYVPPLAEGLTRKGWQITVTTARGHDRGDRFPFPVHRLTGSMPLRLVKSIVRFPALTRGRDLTYVNGMSFEYTATLPVHRTPYVLKVVGDRSWERYRLATDQAPSIEAFQTASLPLRHRLDRWIRRSVARRAAGVIVPSRYLKGIVEEWGVPEQQIRVIYNSVHPPDETSEGPTVSWPGGGLRLLTAGRLVPWKRVPDLIRRLAFVEDAGLIVLGDGPDREPARRAVRRHGLKERVTFKGSVDRASVWRHLRACDLLLLHSTYEGFPHLLLEAMACGAPVLASASGGTRELARMYPDRIALYDRDRPAELTRRLREGLFPDRREPPSVPEPLRWDSVLDQTAQFLETCARRS